MRTEYITTKIRPILKLFIIEPNDFESFEKIIKDITGDIDMIFNIFLENNDELFSVINKEFVKRQNPDIIFNLSNQKNILVTENFNIRCITPKCDITKITRYVSDFRFISNTPSFINNFNKELDVENVFYANCFNKNDNESIINTINFGLNTKGNDDLPFGGVFKDIKMKPIDSISIINDISFKKEKSFNRLYERISPLSSGYGGSIYEINYSHPKHFDKGKYIFISSKKSLNGIIYFWNMRASNPDNDFFWLAKEAIDEYKFLFTDDVTIVTIDNIQDEISKYAITNEIINVDKLYFKGLADRWKLFKHSQTINISNSESILISHPIEKSFSEFGMGGACIFEVSGLNEFYYPNYSKIGSLYELKTYDKDFFSERFMNLYNNKLSKYYLDINILEMRDLSIEIRLPDFREVIKTIFENKNYILKSTDKTSIFDQLINIVGGISNISILCKEEIYTLMNDMTPSLNSKKIKNDLQNSFDQTQKFKNSLNIGIENGTIELKPAIREFSNLKALLEKDDINIIYSKKLLLRGKHFKCEHCSSKIWTALENISRVNYCDACTNEIHIPVDENDKFRLNQLIIKAFDQGQIATLLLLNFFTQNARQVNFLANIEILKSDVNNVFTDLDLVLKIGSKIGFAECKSNSAFNNKQIDDLINISNEIKSDFIILSTLLEKDDTCLQKNIKYLQTKTINVPLLIFTKEVLFKPDSIRFIDYFEVSNNEFKKGIFLLAENY